MAWKRSEQPKDTILRISSSRNAIIVQEHTPGGAVSYCLRRAAGRLIGR